MSNPTFGLRSDRKPFGAELLDALSAAGLGSPETFSALFVKGSCSADVEGSPITMFLQNEKSCLVIQPRGEPGWTSMFNICREYARREGVWMVLFDEEYTHCMRIDGESTVEQVYQTMESDPYQAERMMKELGVE